MCCFLRLPLTHPCLILCFFLARVGFKISAILIHVLTSIRRFRWKKVWKGLPSKIVNLERLGLEQLFVVLCREDSLPVLLFVLPPHVIASVLWNQSETAMDFSTRFLCIWCATCALWIEPADWSCVSSLLRVCAWQCERQSPVTRAASDLSWVSSGFCLIPVPSVLDVGF